MELFNDLGDVVIRPGPRRTKTEEVLGSVAGNGRATKLIEEAKSRGDAGRGVDMGGAVEADAQRFYPHRVADPGVGQSIPGQLAYRRGMRASRSGIPWTNPQSNNQ